MNFRVLLLLSALSICSFKLFSQSGDQILDGIGETGLVSRYIFDGNTKDWSRNNLHAQLKNSSALYLEDTQFDKVLALKPQEESFIAIPGPALNNLESLSISTWVYLNSENTDTYIYDFGSFEGGRFSLVTAGSTSNTFKARLLKGSSTSFAVNFPKIDTGKWVHFVVVIDVFDKKMKAFLNGNLVDSVLIGTLELETFFNSSNSRNKLYLGGSIADESNYLDARLHDFRIYRVPLTENQISGIYQNALDEEGGSFINERPEDAEDLQQFADTAPQLYVQFLKSVSPIELETPQGTLPRLPRYVDAKYYNGIKGPQVRVLWPAPKNNDEVSQAGEYVITGRIAGSDLKPQAKVTVKGNFSQKTPNLKLTSFPLNQVSLDVNKQGEESKFIENRDKFISTLAQTNPDDFLYMFRNAFGEEQPQGAEALGVWDTQETKLRGHASGHYLTALAQAYASTSYEPTLQKSFKDKMEYMVNILYDLAQKSGKPAGESKTGVSDPTKVPVGLGRSGYDSDLSEEGIRTDYWNWGEGYISAYPPDQFIMLENGATYGGQPTQIWAPYYTLHKILAGLIAVYEVSGDEKALQIAKGMGSWVYARLSKVPTETLISMWNRYIAGEFGGMNESMAHLYRITKDPKYLETAKLFDNIKVFYGNANHSHGLAKNVDTYRGLHANQHIPQIIGAIEMYRDSDEADYYNVADNFWYKTTNDYMYSIGGVAGARNPANAECFISAPGTLYENGFSAGGQNETCATYNMLKLSRDLFMFDPRAELMDYYERALYNHILASVAEDSPANTYHVPLRAGSIKQFGNPDMKGFTCCNGTAIESSTKLQNTIYFRSVDNQALYVNLFIPSTLNWKERNIVIKQETSFPNEGQSQFKISGSGKFTLNLRVPKWANKDFKVRINGKKQRLNSNPGSYLAIVRNWKDGDLVEVEMPFQFHLEPVMDQQNIASLFYGPILLVAQEKEPVNTWRKVSFDAKKLNKSIEGNPKELQFFIDGVEYKPFYESYGRYSAYLDVSLN